ncbi:DUF4245 domain-containing protein [Haloechinothrix sp. LS1_15]|uniref:DUF4245 domain-containing protein n=1 Tax=Haloechinothrix sp. LS1_15 TaxID=2652248 RepID=UPI002944EE49|nr:DUF4245 domain-containing protein [Haloechinothrix sp. LS1_15]MDV6011534.1 DUF4245 domain-containing protein [Haloechinothrix sp. LS1_15]
MSEQAREEQDGAAPPGEQGSEQPGEQAPQLDESTAKRLGQGVRDLVLSLAILLGIIAVISMIIGSCEFSPGGPSVDPDAAPEVDAGQELQRMATRVDFPVRSPELGQDWQATSANSAAAVNPEADTIVRVGWLTPGGEYIRLSQSPAPAPYVVADETERSPGALEATGEVTVGDHEWQEYPALENEVAWVVTLDEVQVMITGSAGEKEFGEMARAVLEAEPAT